MGPWSSFLLLAPSVFTLTHASPHLRTPRAFSTAELTISTNLPKKWSYLGCYADSVANRQLSGFEKVDSKSMTQESCIALCESRGYSRAGLQYSSECFCGDTVLADTKVIDSDCNMPCTASSGHACGGRNRLTVFSNGETRAAATVKTDVEGWTSEGCYTDSVGARALSVRMGVHGAMTVGLCTAACKKAGLALAGVEYGNECYCDDAIQNLARPAGDGCTRPCEGDSSELCGGSDRLNLYKVISSSPVAAGAPSTSASSDGQTWTAMGCYTDSKWARALPVSTAVSGGWNSMTVEACQNACLDKGFPLAGVEYGSECYCGAKIENDGALAKDGDKGCKMPCLGKSKQMCGGGDRINIFSYGFPTPSVTETANTQRATMSTDVQGSASSDAVPSDTSSTEVVATCAALESSVSVSRSLTVTSFTISPSPSFPETASTTVEASSETTISDTVTVVTTSATSRPVTPIIGTATSAVEEGVSATTSDGQSSSGTILSGTSIIPIIGTGTGAKTAAVVTGIFTNTSVSHASATTGIWTKSSSITGTGISIISIVGTATSTVETEVPSTTTPIANNSTIISVPTTAPFTNSSTPTMISVPTTVQLANSSTSVMITVTTTAPFSNSSVFTVVLLPTSAPVTNTSTILTVAATAPFFNTSSINSLPTTTAKVVNSTIISVPTMAPFANTSTTFSSGESTTLTVVPVESISVASSSSIRFPNNTAVVFTPKTPSIAESTSIFVSSVGTLIPTESTTIASPSSVRFNNGTVTVSAPTLSFTQTTSIAAFSTMAIPTPTQPGTVEGCTKFHKVQSSDGCWAIASEADISLSDFYTWNPRVGTDCLNLWANYYVCTGISPAASSPITDALTTPTATTFSTMASAASSPSTTVADDACENDQTAPSSPTTTVDKSLATDIQATWGKLTSDETCGGDAGMVCPEGECCSQYGWCGTTKDYCEAGCQTRFGDCN